MGVAEWRTVLEPHVQALPEREQTILRLRFVDGLTQSEIAAQIGLSQMHVSRLLVQSLATLRERCGAVEDGVLTDAATAPESSWAEERTSSTTYRRRRDPAVTPEPVPAPRPPRRQRRTDSGAQRRFVIQEHHARALHWDFRLERDGVLVSWAIPKGLPLDKKTNHLAVHTEDHPLEYATFEGTIPAGRVRRRAR